jgi:tRNA(fMet)-specific endonuclease VapC
MSPAYLLDTNICIYIHHRRLSQVVARFRQVKPGDAAISIVTYGELLFGAAKSARRAEAWQIIEEFAGSVGVRPLPIEAAMIYAELRADLEAAGTPIGGNDLWIASHAIAEGLTLITNNEREFKRIRGLNVENWVK